MSVTTSYAAALSSSSIILNGTLDDLHGEASLTVSFEWGTTTAYGNETTPSSKSATGLFSADLDASTLDEFHATGNTYCFRAKATDGLVTYYGINRYFVNLNVLGSDPFIINNALDDGILTNLEVFDNVLMLEILHGMTEEPTFSGAAIISVSKPGKYDEFEFSGAEISGVTIT